MALTKRDYKRIPLLQLATFGIYYIIWCVRSRREVNEALGRAAVPTVWWFIVPFGGVWWAWLYSGALQDATGGAIKRDYSFGTWFLANLWMLGPSNFPRFNYEVNDKSGPPHVNVALVVAAVLFVFVISILGLSIFPMAVQLKINKLGDTPAAPVPPAPAAPTPPAPAAPTPPAPAAPVPPASAGPTTAAPGQEPPVSGQQ